MKLTSLLLALFLATVTANSRADDAAPAAKTDADLCAVGEILEVSLDAGEKQDFNFDLPKGQFYVYCDARRLGEGSLTTSIDASLQLLKRNGAEIPQYGGDLIYWNAHEKEARAGKPFSFSKPTSVRFRLKNQSDGSNTFWLTVMPAEPFEFLPFGFGTEVIEGKIGPNNGTGGTLEHREFSYIRAAIPAGKWSVSLGAKEAEGRCYASLQSLDARGLDYPQSFSLITTANDVGGEARKEKIVTLTKPTTLIFRVYNEGAASQNPITYDVTIEPSTV